MECNSVMVEWQQIASNNCARPLFVQLHVNMLINFTNNICIYLDDGHQHFLAETQSSTQVIIVFNKCLGLCKHGCLDRVAMWLQGYTY